MMLIDLFNKTKFIFKIDQNQSFTSWDTETIL